MVEQAPPPCVAEFVACIPDLQSALTIAGDGSGRLKLDISEQYLPAVLRLIAFGRNQALMVRVHPT
jgi:hypothetical protein